LRFAVLAGFAAGFLAAGLAVAGLLVVVFFIKITPKKDITSCDALRIIILIAKNTICLKKIFLEV
jgi:hypothetical protein|tara:strand:- start:121 stop:315 length:195 start_codon:yes stop_codon:yes gene_type:complete